MSARVSGPGARTGLDVPPMAGKPSDPGGATVSLGVGLENNLDFVASIVPPMEALVSVCQAALPQRGELRRLVRSPFHACGQCR